MKIKNKKTRGFVISISVMLLAIALLYFALIVSIYSNSLKSANAELAGIERVNSQYDSASYGIKSILSAELVNVTIAQSTGTTANISFKQNLSETARARYFTEVGRFQSFIQAQAIEGNVTVNLANGVSAPVIYVRPANITVSYTVGKVAYSPLNNAYSAGRVTGYSLLIKLNDRPTPGLNWTTLNTLSASDPNAVYFHIGVQGTNGTVSDTKYLDKYQNSTLLMQNSGGQSVITVQARSPAYLDVNYALNLNGSMETILQLNNTATVELGSGSVINISRVGEIEKTGTVILVES
ncbi:Uncharacterised protein [Candidatus Gugararchaeum adminiculabundum]|nr:Uncharacterised protein [Candidatus Gugararchaeum adminiculabundum]